MLGVSKSLVGVDIFCGAGGLSYGMKKAGIEVVAGVDVDPSCQYAFEANVNASFILEDVTKLRAGSVMSLYPDSAIRVLSGCAPCQPFSSYTSRYFQAERWRLLGNFSQIVAGLKPEIVTMENVPRLKKHPIFLDFLSCLSGAGYTYNHSIVSCAEYGVPQTRRRLVLLASLLGDIKLIAKTHGPADYITVQDAIQHLDPIEAGQSSEKDPLHTSSALSEKNMERIRQSKPGGTWRDWPEGLRAACHVIPTGKTYTNVYGRMMWDSLAPTITTQFNGFGNGRFGHPEQDRAISLREGALLQTFPDGYSFMPEGTPVQFASVARLIGNAVPVNLGEAIGRSIVAHLEESS